MPLSRPSGLTSRMPLPGCSRHRAAASARGNLGAQRPVHVRREARRLPIVERERRALVLEHQPVVPGGEARELAPQPREPGLRQPMAVDRCRRRARRSSAVLAGDRQRQAREQPIGVGDRAAGDQRDRAAELVARAPAAARRRASSTRTSVGVGRQVEQRAVDVEEQRAPRVERRRRPAPWRARTPRARRRSRSARRGQPWRDERSRPRGSGRAGASPPRRAACVPPSGRR